MKPRYLFFLLLIPIIFSVSHAQTEQKKPIGKADKVLVVKSERKMYLMKKGEIIRTYTIALGDNPIGHKQKEGDERTPEGNYIIDWRNAHSHYHKSLHISYPNAEDKKRAKAMNVSPGGNIMIHGLPPAYAYLGAAHTKYDWTDGCIAVTDKEIDEIWNSVPDGTPIEIRK